MMDMKIRKMKAADYDRVYALWMRTPGMGLNDLDDSIEGITQFLNHNPETCFVLEEGDIYGVVLTGNDGRRGYIYHLAVDPIYRGKGYGKSLVEYALTALKDMGVNKVALVVFETNEKGNAFWDHMGFSTRPDLIYRNRALVDIKRIDT